MQNLSRENEFYFHDNKKSFSQERFCTWPRFKTEACGILEMAYCFVGFLFVFDKKLLSVELKKKGSFCLSEQ